MLAVCSSETSVNNYQTTRCHNPDDHYVNNHHRENLKSHMLQHLHAFYPCIPRAVRKRWHRPVSACYSIWLRSSFGFFFIPYCDLVTLVRRFRKASVWLIHHITSSYHIGYPTQFSCTSDGMWHMWQPGRRCVALCCSVHNGLALELSWARKDSIHALISC
jgi:hypothetical protein